MKIALNFKYSIDLEKSRVLNVIKKLSWYHENDYEPDLPKNKKDIEKEIIDEYNPQEFNESQEKIQKAWQTFTLELPEKLKDIADLEETYSIIMTKYGVKGSYNLPNKIIINIRNRTTDDIIRTIIHEIIHLSIEKMIIKFKVSHWQKERIVDLIFDQIYPEINIIKPPKEDSLKIDKVFKEYYPNIEKIIENIS
jgi:hypothetical protein